MKRIAILGSTGSVGCSALSVVATHPDRLEVVSMAAGENITRLAEQVRRHRPSVVAMKSADALDQVRAALGDVGHIEFAPPGGDGLMAVATHPDADVVLCATSGTAALEAVLAAIQAGKTIALANKEVLVMAGAVMMEAARRHGAAMIPVDSEHNAIHQCLHGRSVEEVRRLILTASGGPFWSQPADMLRDVTPEQALDHPTWNMGRKISVDSATMMNKGLEVIEARWLFDVPPTAIDIVVHPQSVAHSFVELCDGSLIAQLGVTDMRLPIQYALSYPERWTSELPALDLAAAGRLDFHRPDKERFPCVGLAYLALGGSSALPAILNAANEVAVDAFLERRLPFLGIPDLIARALDAGDADGIGHADSVEAVREIDSWTRRFSEEALKS